MKLGFVEISSSVFFLIYSKSSFIILTHGWLNATTSSPSTKHDFNVLSNTQYTILSRRDFVLFAILSVTKKSFNYLNLALNMIQAKNQNNKNKAVKFSFKDRNSRWRRAKIFKSQWNSRVLFLWHMSVKSVNLFNFLTRNVFLFLRLKTSNKHLVSFEFSVRTVS